MSARGAAIFLAVALALAGLGEGGAHPTAALIVRGAILSLWIVVLARGLSGESRGVGGWPLRLFAAAAACVALGGLLAPEPYAALLVGSSWLWFGVIAWIAGRLGPGLWTPLAWTAAVAALAETGILVWQRWVAAGPRPGGTFLNTNHAAIWVVALALVAWGGRGRLRPLAFAALAAAASALVLTGSRGALAGAAVGAVVLLARLTRGRRRQLALTGCFLAATAAGIWILRARADDPFLYNRLRIWQASSLAAVEDPWRGAGPGQFADAGRNLNFPLEAPARYARFFNAPHSDLLRLPVEFGMPTALLALAAVVASLVALRRSSVPPGVAAALAAVGAHACVDDLSDRPAIWMLAAALLGAALSRAVEGPPRRTAWVRLLTCLLLLHGFLVFEWGDWRAWRDGTGENHAAVVVPGDRPLGLADYERSRIEAEDALRRAPRDLARALTLARLESRGCRELFGDVASRERAARTYDRAHELSIHDPFILIEKGYFLLQLGDPAGARRSAERALGIEPLAVPARLLLAEAWLASSVDDGPARAEGLLAEARSIAAEHGDDAALENEYAFRLLSLDQGAVSRLEAGR